jgi:gliding motility associated protien GldN
MKQLRFLVLIFLAAISVNVSYAQDGEVPEEEEDFIGDFTYTRYSIRERKPVPYPSQREADVMYARRIVRIMDTKEKQNLICRWPKNPLSVIIFEAAEKGEITAFKNDSLQNFYRPDTVIDMLSQKEVIQVPDRMFPGEFKDSVVINKFNYEEDVVRYEIIEDWIFDKQRGIFYPRIIAFSPLYKLIVDGQDLGELPAFFCSWPELREVFINEEIFNRHNDAAKFSYYDWFELRLFSSYIVKEPNVFDLKFNEYTELKDNPLAQLLEGERVKDELFNWEHDLWQY